MISLIILLIDMPVVGPPCLLRSANERQIGLSFNIAHFCWIICSSLRHWKLNGSCPSTTAVNSAVDPGSTSSSPGPTVDIKGIGYYTLGNYRKELSDDQMKEYLVLQILSFLMKQIYLPSILHLKVEL